MHMRFSCLNKYWNIKRQKWFLNYDCNQGFGIMWMAHKSIPLMSAWLSECMDLKALYRLWPLWLYKLQFQQPQFNLGKNQLSKPEVYLNNNWNFSPCHKENTPAYLVQRSSSWCFNKKNAVYSEIYTKHTGGKIQHSLMSKHTLRVVSIIL
jgi:hypothetical protein